MDRNVEVAARLTDDEILAEVEARGLNLGVNTRDLVELMCARKSCSNTDNKLCKQVISRVCREHLGKII